MPLKIVHRIYTEEKNKAAIVRLVSARFQSFTIQPTLGYYRGKRERSIVVEIVGATRRQIEDLARLIQRMNGQKSVLILATRGNIKVTRGNLSDGN